MSSTGFSSDKQQFICDWAVQEQPLYRYFPAHRKASKTLLSDLFILLYGGAFDHLGPLSAI